MFLYHADSMVSGGGANFMLECVRQAMADLANLLLAYKCLTTEVAMPMVLPTQAVFSFDNCPSENKV